MDVVDITNELARTTHNRGNTLRPSSTAAYKDQEKIPIPQEDFDRLCVPYSRESSRNAFSAQQLLTLFRVSADEHAVGASEHFLTAIRLLPLLSGTECLYTTYDINISHNVNFILSEAKPIRDSNRNTNTALKLPDYAILVSKYCIL